MKVLPPIDLGVILAGPLEEIDRLAVDAALESVRDRLSEWQSDFDWRFPVLRRSEWAEVIRVEPSELLAQARELRDANGWDFAIVITSTDLVSHYKPFSMAVISRSLDLAIISTARIDPRAEDEFCSEEERRELMRQRIVYLMLHTLGHWSGLGHHPDPDNVMHDIHKIEDLIRARQFTDSQRESMTRSLLDVADQRLEEHEEPRGWRSMSFVARAVWRNRGEIIDAVWQAKPWEFPTRLSRFTTAAVSTVLVLLMTAETWDMAMSQSFFCVAGLFAVALSVTTAYVVTRQQLFMRRIDHRLSEQIVTTNVSAILTVVLGVLTMFAILLGICFLASSMLFPDNVAVGWAASLSGPIQWRHYLMLAGVVSSLGILIGALGASFEDQHYFRHVIFVDEEI